jgi:hypothetical protein
MPPSLLAQAGQSFRPIHIIDVFTHDCSGYFHRGVQPRPVDAVKAGLP